MALLDTIISSRVPEVLHFPSSDIIEEVEDIHGEKIKTYINKYIKENQPLTEAKWKRNCRIGLKILAGIIGGTAGLPYVENACNAGKYYSLCVPFSIGTVVAYGSAAAWVGLSLVSNLDPITEVELHFNEALGNNKLRKHILVNILGLLSSIPDIYSVYHYNTIKWLVIPAFIVGYTFKSQGYYELYQKLEYIFSKDSIVASDKQIESNMMQQIIMPSVLGCTQDSLDEKKEEVILKLKNLLNSDREEDFLPSIEDLSSIKIKIFKKVVQTVGLVFPIGNVLVNGTLGYNAASLITKSPWFCYPAMVLLVAPGFVLDTVISTATIGEIYDIVHNIVQQRSEKTFFSDVFPKLSKGLPIVCVTLATFSAAGDAYVAYDTISKSSLSILKLFLPWMVFGANTIFESYTGTNLFQSFIKEGYKHCGDIHNISKLKLMEGLEKVASFFEARNNIYLKKKNNANKDEASILLEDDRAMTNGTFPSVKEQKYWRGLCYKSRCSIL